nr:hypothetical protein [Tanacetum cinerariifolium]
MNPKQHQASPGRSPNEAAMDVIKFWTFREVGKTMNSSGVWFIGCLQTWSPAIISSRFVPKPSSSTPYVPPSRNDWDLLFQPLFDELLTPPPSVDPSAPEVIAPIVDVIPPVQAESTGSPSSTTLTKMHPHQVNLKQHQKHNLLSFLKMLKKIFMILKLHIWGMIHYLETQQYGAILPIELTTAEIRNSKAYQEYHACAMGEAAPKPKASGKKKKGDFASSTTPPTLTPTTKADHEEGKESDDDSDDGSDNDSKETIKSGA